MKKLCFSLILALIPCFANGLSVGGLDGIQLFLHSTKANLNETQPDVDGTRYYKCSDSVPYNCASYGVLISYTGTSGGKGTQTAPIILTGCRFIDCACPSSQFVDEDKGTKGCSNCVANSFGSVDGGWHTNTACMCDTGYYINLADRECSLCPSWGGAQGTTDGPGSNLITDCFIAAGSEFADDGGEGSVEDKCYYSEEDK